MKRHILIYSKSDGKNNFQKIAYLNLLNEFGAVEMISPLSLRENHLDADVLVLPGGADVDPKRYGEIPSWWTQRGDWLQEFLDAEFLPKWIESGKPIIGICRGMQSLNVALGGTLFQHIESHDQSAFNMDRVETSHAIYSELQFEEDDFRIYQVNSFHHQAVRELAPGMEMIAWSHTMKGCPSLQKRYAKGRILAYKKYTKEDGEIVPVEKPVRYNAIPEIIKHKELPYIGFQYHPEDMNCKLFDYLVTEMLS